MSIDGGTMVLLGTASLIAWCFILLRPARPWSMRESLQAGAAEPVSLTDVTVLIPARNESATLGDVLDAALAQGSEIDAVVVDDESDDATPEIARGFARVELVAGTARPPDWAGKLWAQQQGRARLRRPYTLLLDADIALAPGMVAAMRERLLGHRLAFVSLLAQPPMGSIFERLLLPAYVYFFKLLYPFASANDPRSSVAAAAGGAMLIRTAVLKELDAFAAIRGELIDDCALARLVKGQGLAGWTGVSRDVVSLRDSGGLAGIWHMVSRHAFTQLHYSLTLLAATTLIMLVMFIVPVAGVFAISDPRAVPAVAAYVVMGASYAPTLLYYRLSPLWCLFLPAAGLLYLLMTWWSACRYWLGKRAVWRGRTYYKQQEL